jgi:hypothetical protein
MYDTEVIELELPDGSTVLARVEAADLDVSAFQRIKLADVSATAARVAHWAKHSALTALPRRPDRLSVEVGIAFTVQSGALVSLIAAGASEASIKLILEWDVNESD